MSKIKVKIKITKLSPPTKAPLLPAKDRKKMV